MSERVKVSSCQRRLALAWFIGGGLVFLVVVVQTMAGHYGEKTKAAWSWLLPTIMPTLSLIVGAVVSQQPQSTATVDRLAYRISMGLSLCYLLLVLATLAVQPFTGTDPLDLMSTSNLWLGPVQGLLGIALGVFFGSRKT